MTALDNFHWSRVHVDMDCAECGTSGVLLFWEPMEASKDRTDSNYDHALCGDCLLTAEGRFKNEAPAQVLREHEEIKQAYLTKDDTLCIQTTSPIGDFEHLFHLETSVESTQAGIDPKSGQPAVEQKAVKELSGVSGIYSSDGEFLTEPSVYGDVAVDVLAGRSP